MKTKILYVLVSTIDDIFAEQTYLSIFSLRKNNKEVSVSLLMDNKTAESLKDRSFDLLAMVDEPIIVDLPEEMSNKYKSRVLKTSMRNYVDGDFLYIDSDTIILSDLSSIDKIESNIAAVFELNRPFKLSTSKRTLTEIYKRLGEDINSLTDYYNSGVLFVKDTLDTRVFFNEWNKTWENGTKNGVLFDQPSLGVINNKYSNIITPLDGIWNCQGRYGINYSKDVKIFHYLYDKGFDFPLLDKDRFTDFKTTGEISSDIKMILNDPYRNVSANNIIINNDDIIIFGSKLFSVLRFIYNHHTFYFIIENLLNGLYSIFLSLKKRNLFPPR